MPVIRKAFMSIIRCIGCGFVGAFGALILAVCVYFLATLFTPNNPKSLNAELMILVAGYCGIFVGFGLGAIYGAIRGFTSLEVRTALIATSVIGVTVLLMYVLFLAI